MRKRTIAVLVLFWGTLSAILLACFHPVLFAWVTTRLADFEPHQATMIASAIAGTVLLLAAALITFLMTRWARPASSARPRSSPARVIPPPRAQPKAAALGPFVGASSGGQMGVPLRTDAAITAPLRSGASANHAARRLIRIKPDKTLVHSGLRFGLVRVADPEEPGQNHGGLSEEIYFKKRDNRGTLIAQVPRDGRRFQFKCFVDYRGTKFDRVRNSLSAAGFNTLTARPNKQFRVWFVLPNYRTRKASGDQTYNIV
jgi:hypothetical protein